VTEMLARFNARFPGLQVSVRVGNSEDVLAALLDYQTDVAVLAQFTEDPRFHFVPYSRHPIVVFVPRTHRFAGTASIRIGELEGEGMILREEGSTTRKAFDDATERAGVKPRVLMEIGSREAIREAVIKGVGIGVVSEIEFVPDPAICAVPVSDADMFTYAHVVCLRERRGARLVEAFLRIVDELLAGRARPDSQQSDIEVIMDRAPARPQQDRHQERLK
jgi:LysR family transcriptional regulator, low CO2-responsive transcriptional regulator